MSEKEIIEAYTSNRNRPVNLTNEDQRLFAHEFEKNFKAVSAFIYKYAWIDSGGIISSFFLLLRRSSFVNLRITDQFAFEISHYPKFLLKIPRIKKEKYLWISERWSHGYFHWLCDALPRLFIIESSISDHHVLLPIHYNKYSYISESLDFLNISYRFIPRGNKFFSSEIVFSQPVCSTGNFYPPIMRIIRDKLRDRSVSDDVHSRVYVSRKFAKVRRIENEDECLPIFKAYGFETVYLEQMNFDEQMRFLYHTEVILGVHGAGLTNMIACSVNCRVIEIRGKSDSKNNCFYSLASALNLDYYYLLAAENPTPVDHVGDVHIDLNLLESLLAKYFEKNKGEQSIQLI